MLVLIILVHLRSNCQMQCDNVTAAVFADAGSLWDADSKLSAPEGFYSTKIGQ